MPFIKAAFEINLPKLNALLDRYDLDPELFRDTHLCPGQHIPIHWIPLCWQHIIGNTEAWAESIREKVISRKADNERILDLLSERGATITPINFHTLSHEAVPFFRRDANDSDDDILYPETMASLLQQDHQLLDLQLYCAVCRFDYAEAQRLLMAGAIPDTDDDYNCMDRIGKECSFLGIEMTDYLLHHRLLKPRSYHQSTVDLLGWAAHEHMYALLEKYKDNPPTV